MMTKEKKEGYGGGTVSCLTHNYKDLGFDIKVKIPDTVTNTSDPSNKTAECSALDGTLTTHLYFLFLVLMCLYFKLKNSLHHSSTPSFPWASLPPFLLSLLCFFLPFFLSFFFSFSGGCTGISSSSILPLNCIPSPLYYFL